MQAILTKYLPPTNTKPSRIKASCERGSIVVLWDDEFNPEHNHIQAVDKLVAKFACEDGGRYGSQIKSNPWLQPRATGSVKGGEYVHVFVR